MNLPKKAIYTIATSHLDTSWNWTFEKTLNEFLPRTLYDNFDLLEKYPDYRFSFEGSYRYELMEEYFPKEFERLKAYVAAGRWFPAGSAYENGDVNIPSPEALFRNFLFGSTYFQKTFQKKSADVFLPDCFGFGWALPSIASHCGILGFTTQKLTWSSFAGVPFDLGKWRGVDENSIYALFDAGGYERAYRHSVRNSYVAPTKLRANLRQYGLPYTAILHGIGDRGGAPKACSVCTVSREQQRNENSAVEVLSVSSDRIFRDLSALPAPMQQRLPVYDGELVSTDHGAGGYTSRTASKRLNRRCEQLGEAAERFSVMADFLGGFTYNQTVLDEAWKRTVAHQFHDDITGTSLLECYRRNWNDSFLSLGQFAEEYRAAADAVGAQLDTSFVKGKALLVTNPTQYCREEVVTVQLPKGSYRVTDRQGKPLPISLREEGGETEVCVLAEVPPFGEVCYDLQSGEPENFSALSVSPTLMENEFLRVTLNADGDVESIFRKDLKRELLLAPIRLALLDYEGSIAWPAWECSYRDICRPAAEYPKLESVSVLCEGGARGSILVEKRARNSVFKTVISLDAGSKRLVFHNEVDWRAECTMLKAEFPLAVAGDALYDLGLGYIRRPNNTPRRFEVPAQMWAAIPAREGNFTVAVLSDSRVGWDKPADNVLRLTCMHSPKSPYREGSAQHLLDFGYNRFSFAVCASAGDTRTIQREAICFHQPPAGFLTAARHGGAPELSFGQLSTDGVLVRALKKSQDGKCLVLRVNEAEGFRREGVRFALGNGIKTAVEANGLEEPAAAAVVKNGELVFSIPKFGIKTFLLTLEKPAKPATAPRQEILTLPGEFNPFSDNACRRGESALGNLTFPTELFGERTVGGIRFAVSKTEKSALSCKGQTLSLPRNAQCISLLLASVSGDREAVFTLGKRKITKTVPDLTENIGEWDLLALERTGYVKQAVPALCFTHVHEAYRDVRGKNAYWFRLDFPVNGETTLTLPLDEAVCVFAATLSFQTPAVTGSVLYDRLERRPCDFRVTPELTARHECTKKEQKAGHRKFILGYAARQLAREIAMRK